METKKQIVQRIVKSGGSIIDIARQLDETIAEVSNTIGTACKTSEKAREFFANYPKFANIGYIYQGGYDQCALKGETEGMLKVFDHVLGGREIQRGKHFHREIFRAVQVVRTKYIIGKKVNNKPQNLKIDGKDKCIYLSDEEIKEGKLKEFMEQYGCTIYKKMQSQEISYVRGMWLGTPNVLSLVSVNYDWR